MENNQYPNNQTPNDAQHAPEEVTYVRVEDAQVQDAGGSSALQAPPSEAPQEDAANMAMPVGAPYENKDAQDEVYSEGASCRIGAEKTTENTSEAAAVQAVKPPTGKTKRKKHGNFGKFVAVLLIGALIGGAAGGAIGYTMADRGNTTPIASPQEIKDAPKDANGNLSIETIAQHAMPAVVSVYNMANVSQNPFASGMFGSIEGDQNATTGGSPTAQGYGSGVLISADGLIVTNYHVIEDSDSVVVTVDGDKEYDAEVLGTDATLDLAVLKIEGKDFPYVDIANSDDVKVGQLAVAIGNPLGSEFEDTVTDGIISGVDRKISSENGDLGLLQTNASINSGNSGGALLNGQAQLIGINSMKIQSSGMAAVEGMGFAIPSNTVLDFVNSVKDGSHTKNSTKKAWIGISGYSMNESIARQLGTEQNTGILVAGVTEGSPAQQAGLEQADIIIGADGQAIETFDDLTKVIKAKQPGDKIELTVIRQGQTGTISVTLGSQK